MHFPLELIMNNPTKLFITALLNPLVYRLLAKRFNQKSKQNKLAQP